jgi:hypothetical protein
MMKCSRESFARTWRTERASSTVQTAVLYKEFGSEEYSKPSSMPGITHEPQAMND